MDYVMFFMFCEKLPLLIRERVILLVLDTIVRTIVMHGDRFCVGNAVYYCYDLKITFKIMSKQKTEKYLIFNVYKFKTTNK